MYDGMAFDSLKKWTQTNTAFSTLYYISSAELPSNYLCGPCLGIIINSRIAKPNRLYCLQNMSVYFQVLQSDGINVIGEFLKFIYNISNIRVLAINCTKEISVTCDVLSATVKTITANPNLECISISDNFIDDSDFSKIAEKLKNILSLKSIDISRNQISNKNFDTLELILSRNTGLKHLNFSNTFVCEIASSVAMRSLRQLTHLDISSTLVGIRQSAIVDLCEIISANINLEHINLSGNKLGENIEKLFSAIKDNHKALKLLNICDNQVPYQAVESISVVLHNNPNLQELDISFNTLSDETIGHGIKSIIKSCNGKQLKVLNLNSVGAVYDDSDELSALLRDCIDLIEIDLSFGNLNIVKILSAMNILHFLQTISLRRCNVSVSDTNKLALLIKHNAQLRILDISDNSIEAVGFQRVLDALFAHHVNIKVLNVSRNKIELDGNHHVLKKVSSKKLQLAELDLSGNLVNESSYVELLKHFIDLKYMKILNISQPESENGPSMGVDNIIKELMHFATELAELDISGYVITQSLPINFQQHSKLKKVTLRNCKINDHVAIQLKNYFKLETLKHLDVSKNPMDISNLDNSVKRINTLKLQQTHILQTNLLWILDSNSMHTLHLCGNNLEDKWLNRLKGVEQMTEILGHFLAGLHNASLKVLCLNDCKLKIEETFRIINALQSNQSLEIIHLCNNLITDNKMRSCYKNLRTALTKNSTIQELCFWNDKMKPETIAEVMMHCAQCSTSIKRIKIPWISEDWRVKIMLEVEQIREKRSNNGKYTGLYAVFTREQCQH